MGKIKLILGASILLFTSIANAAIINAFNTNTEYAPHLNADLQGLDWLTLDNTLGESPNTVNGLLDTYEGGGWRYATRLETETLTGSLWGGTISGFSLDNANGARWFNDIFSVTWSTPSSYFPVLDYSDFFFGAPGDCDPDLSLTCYGSVRSLTRGPLPGQIPAVRVSDGEVVIQELVPFESYGFFTDTWGLNAGLYDWNSTRLNTLESATLASLLVRTNCSEFPGDGETGGEFPGGGATDGCFPGKVPEPPAILLFGIGLIGLIGFTRRRKVA